MLNLSNLTQQVKCSNAYVHFTFQVILGGGLNIDPEECQVSKYIMVVTI